MNENFYLEWEKTYLEDREKIRRDPSCRFRLNPEASQVSFFNNQGESFASLKDQPFWPKLKSGIYAFSFFQTFLSTVNKNFPKQEIPFLKKFCSEKKFFSYVSVLHTLHQKNSFSPKDLKSFPPKFRPLLQKVFLEHLKEEKAPDPSLLWFSGTHCTQSQRLLDGALLLSNLPYFKNPTVKHPVTLFVGGSVGVIAKAFHASLSSKSQKKWSVFTTDYYSPSFVWKSHFGEKTPFQKFSGITYFQQDMRHLAVPKGKVHYIDACNCIGYINSLNERLDVIKNIWEILPVGGFFRTTTPGYESLFEQIIVRKTGKTIQDWDLVYLNVLGKTTIDQIGDLSDPFKAQALGKKIFTYVKKIQKELLAHPKKFLPQRKNHRPDLSDSVLCMIRDVGFLSPFTLGAGIFDEHRLYTLQQKMDLNQHLNVISFVLKNLKEAVKRVSA